MKPLACAIIILVALSYSNLFGQEPNRIAQELQLKQQVNSLQARQQISPFEVRQDEQRTARSGSGLGRYLLADLSTSVLQQTQRSLDQVISIVVPYFDQDLVLDLYRVDDSPSLVRTSEGEVSYELGLHYRGILRGDVTSLATVSIYDGEVIGLVSTSESGNIVIGEWKEKNAHIIYNDRDVLDKPAFECEVRDAPGQLNQIREEVQNHSRSAAAGCTDIYLEIGYDVYTNKGKSRSSVQSFIGGIFNQVKTIYANENISIKLSEMYIWTRSDPYSGDASSHMDQFMSKRTSYNGDLAHLITLGNGNGGIAYVDVLCSSNFGYGYSDISGGYSNFPTYSWSVNVLAHELGHNFGSDHTHDCVWGPSKDMALDGCFSPEGSCSKGPLPSNGGTIMSYCHLTSVGVNLSRGFGSEPGDRIRSRVNAASCLGSCSGGPTVTCNLSITGFDVEAANCGQEDGQVEINVTGATTSTTYRLGGQSSGSNTFVGLAAGTYVVLVSNGSSCEEQAEVTVASTDGDVELTGDIEDASCGQSNGEVMLRASGGEAPYRFTLDGKTQSNGSFEGLEPGTYAALVVDDQGCSANISVTVEDSNGPSLASDIDHTTCGEDNGQVTLTASGGAGSFTFTLGSASNGSGLFENLAPGTYAASVVDGEGCSASASITVDGNSGPTLSSNIDHTSCGENNGRVALSASGTSGTLTFTLGNNSNSTGLFDDLEAGTYTAQILDGNDCSTTSSIVVESSEAILTEIDVTSTECGEDNGRVEISATGGTGTLRYSIGGSFQSNPVFSGLSAGEYEVRVRDQSSCETQDLEEVKKSDSFTARLESTDTYCGEDNGTLKIQISEGIGPFNYQMNNGTFTTKSNYEKLGYGSYEVTVRDETTGCETKMSTSIKSSRAIESEILVSHTSCGEENGQLTVETKGGVGALDLRINGTRRSANNFQKLAHGEYEIQITDQVGCVVIHQETIEPSEPVTLSAVVEETTCNKENGSIELEATGIDGPYLYKIDGRPYTATAVFTDIPAGRHTVSAKDNAGCEVMQSVDVEASQAAELAVMVKHTTCALNNGTLEVDAKVGTGPFTYLLNGQETEPNDMRSLTPGNYQIQMLDSKGCEAAAAVSIESSVDIEFTTEVLATTCGEENGQFKTEILSGTAPFTYRLDDQQVEAVMADVAAGTYVLEVIDADGCKETEDIVIDASNAIEVAVQSESTTCGEDNGLIAVEAVGGTGSLSFSLDETYTDQVEYISLAPQTYFVKVRDEVGCIIERAVEILPSTSPQTTLLSEHTRCGEENGSIAIDIQQGVAPYTIDFNGSTVMTEKVLDLAPGEYQIKVTDIHGCETFASTQLDESTAPIFSATSVDANCYQANGELLIEASSGIGPYRYSIGDDFQSSDRFSKVDSGIYLVTVVDSEDCAVEQEISVKYDGQYVAPVLPVESSLCDGEAILLTTGLDGNQPVIWSRAGEILDETNSDLNVHVAGEYKATINYHAGCVLSASSLVQVHARPTQSIPADASLCYGDIFSIDRESELDTYQWNHGEIGPEVLFQSSGVYTLTTTNEHACSKDSRIDIEVIKEVDLPQPDFSEKFACPGSSLVLSGEGADKYAWFESNQTQAFSNQKDIEVRLDSPTELTLIGSNRCFADTAVIVLAPWQDESILSADTTVVEGAPISIALKGGSDIAWASEYTLSCADCEVTELRPTEPGQIYVDYLDANGCDRSGQVEVDIISLDEALPDLVNVMTPNQDGFNDELRFEGIEYLRKMGLRVFDQQGREIYSSDSYQNDWSGSWDGRVVPEGVYFYVVAFSLDDRVFEFDSPLTILRSEVK